MKNPEEYFEIGRKKLENKIGPDGAYYYHDALLMGLMEAMKDFIDELPSFVDDFQFDSEGNLLVKERNY